MAYTTVNVTHGGVTSQLSRLFSDNFLVFVSLNNIKELTLLGCDHDCPNYWIYPDKWSLDRQRRSLHFNAMGFHLYPCCHKGILYRGETKMDFWAFVPLKFPFSVGRYSGTREEKERWSRTLPIGNWPIYVRGFEVTLDSMVAKSSVCILIITTNYKNSAFNLQDHWFLREAWDPPLWNPLNSKNFPCRHPHPRNPGPRAKPGYLACLE